MRNSQDALGVVGACEGAELSSTAAAAVATVMAAASPFIKAQSDMEVRVSQLAEGVQRLLEADREGGARRRSLSEQTLRQLETIHNQQLHLQIQLLESALRTATGQAPPTSNTPGPAVTSDLSASAQPACLRLTHLTDTGLSSSADGAAAAVEPHEVTVATSHCDRRPEHSR